MSRLGDVVSTSNVAAAESDRKVPNLRTQELHGTQHTHTDGAGISLPLHRTKHGMF